MYCFVLGGRLSEESALLLVNLGNAPGYLDTYARLVGIFHLLAFLGEMVPLRTRCGIVFGPKHFWRLWEHFGPSFFIINHEA